MNRKLWFKSAAILTLAIPAAGASAQSPVLSKGVKLTAVQLPGAVATASSPDSIVFDATELGTAPRQLTASFSMGPGGAFPTASLHYGYDYSLGSVSCAAGNCSVTVTFSPTLPGTRPDALFLTSGGVRVATIPLAGTGKSAYALLQPVNTGAPVQSTSTRQGVLDESGTLFVLDTVSGSVTSTTASGKATELAISMPSAARSIKIDGAGVLYLLPSGATPSIVTFDTVQGTQGSIAIPVPATAIDSISIDATGELQAVSSTSQMSYRTGQDGNVAASPAVVHAADASISAAGTDAAGTLYSSSKGSLLQLAAPAFTTAIAAFPGALAVGSDGALMVQGAQGISRLDRTQTGLDFGDVTASTTTQPQTAQLYNAGNETLSVSDLRVSGDGYSIVASASGGCVAGMDLAAGAFCQVAVGLQVPRTGATSGTLSVVTNSLNQPSSNLKLPLTPHNVGSQAVLTPSALTFPSSIINVATPSQTIILSNPGTAALNLNSVALTGAGSGSYSLTQTCIVGTATSLAPGGSCTITVIFKPLVLGTIAATLSIGDDLNGVAGSSQTAALTGIGTAAPAPVISFSAFSANGLSSGSLTFGSSTNPVLEIPAGSPTTATGTVTITNSGNAVLTISTVAIILSGTSTVLPYTETNNCPATLAVGANCVATIIFAPPSGVGGTYTASLVLVDNAAASPQAFAISGISQTNDYNLTSSTQNITIPSSGGSGNITLTLTPDPGPFTNPIALSVFGVPSAATYTFSPQTVVPISANGISVLSITLPTYKNVVLSSLEKSPLGGGSVPMVAGLLVCLCFGLGRKRLPRLTRALQVLLMGVLALAATSGCGGGVPISGGVAPGTYSITITATSSNGSSTSTGTLYPIPVTHQVVVQLLVQ